MIELKQKNRAADNSKAGALAPYVAVALGALVVMLGWVIHSEPIVKIAPSFAPMQFNTALCFFMLAGAGLCSVKECKQYFGLLFLGIATAISVMSLVQYLLQINCGIDTFFIDPFTTTKTSHPGRMAPNTALAFVLTSSSLFFLYFRETTRPNFTASCTGIFLSFIICASALIAYVLQFETVYGWGDFTRMALHTAVFHLLLASAVIRELGRRVTQVYDFSPVWSGLLALAVCFTVSLFVWQGAQVSELRNFKEKLSRDVRLSTEVLQSTIDSQLALLQGVERFFASSEFVSASEFKDFTHSFLSSSDAILAIDWSPRVVSSQKEALERELKGRGAAGFKMLDENRQITRHTGAEIYYPVIYTEPRSFEVDAIGFDHYSDALRTIEMDAAARSGQPQTTRPFQLFRHPGDENAGLDILVFVPAYASRHPDQEKIESAQDPQLRGFVIGVFRLSSIISTALGELIPDGLHAQLIDPDSNAVFYSFSSSAHGESNKIYRSGFANYATQGSVTVAGREFSFSFVPDDVYFYSEFSLFPAALLLFSLLLSVSTSAYFYILSRQKRELALNIKAREEIMIELREREEWFEQLALSAPIGIYRTDRHGSREYLNPAWCAMTGLSHEKARGDGWVSALHPDDRERVLRTWKQSVDFGRMFDQEFRFKMPDGRVRWVAGNAVPVIREDGEQIGMVGTAFDITELHETTEQLRQATNAKSDFLASMSHEIRTPITSILGFAESLLSDDVNEDEMRSGIQTIARSAEHLRSLVNDILDFSKIEAGKLSVIPEKCSLFDIVDELEAMLQIPATSKGIEFSIEYEFPLPKTIKTDPVRVRQVLVNLIGNAIKFTSKGGVYVRCSYADGYLKFVVQDTGIGMDSESLNRIFESFEQEDRNTSGRFGGTGLGLAISRRLALMLQGSIVVCSEKDKGSTFSFSIPVGDGLELGLVHRRPRDKKPARSSENKTELFHGKVLVAEDTKTNQVLIHRILKSMGLEVQLADNGQVALEMIDSDGAFDLIILDMHMPVMDGFVAAQKIRERGIECPVIAFTAEGTIEGQKRCLRSGCTSILPKPFSRGEVIEVLRKTLGHSQVP